MVTRQATEAEDARPLRILVWSDAGAGPHYNGYGMNAWRLYGALSPGEADVTLLHARPDHAPSDVFARVCQVGSIRAGTVPGRLFVVNQLEVAARAGAAVLRSRDDVDVFHGISCYWPTLGPALAAEAVGVPAVVKVTSEQDLVSWSGAARARKRIRLRALRHVSAVVAVTGEISTLLLRNGIPEERVWSIPNGVDVELFHPAAHAPERRARSRRILFAGEVTRRKRLHLAVAALAALRRDEDAELWVAGPTPDPAYRDEVAATADRLGVAPWVRWLGFVRDMPGCLRRVDALCLPSAAEAMANVVLEAMASGVPFVVTPASGMAELAATGGGEMVAPDPEVLAAALRHVMAHPEGYSAAGRSAAVTSYSTRAVMARHVELFRLLAARRRQEGAGVG